MKTKTPWYLAMFQEMCQHPNGSIKITASCVTTETTILACPDCQKPFKPVTEC